MSIFPNTDVLPLPRVYYSLLGGKSIQPFTSLMNPSPVGDTIGQLFADFHKGKIIAPCVVH
jgi:hypothetical protein